MLFVLKFGGTSLADTRRIRAAAEQIALLAEAGARVVTVVSAQGNTTDRLLDQARTLHPDPPPRELDACLSAGEQMAAALLAMALLQRGVAAVSLTGVQAGIETDGIYGDARITGLRGRRIRQELERGRTVVVTGFQGVGPEGDTVTLGRGGSDTTAVALAAFLQADDCRIYTDVDGVYDKDPRHFPDAVKYDRISCGQMLQLCRRGAQVLHDRSVELAQQYGVRIRVLPAFSPGDGTVVQ